MPWQIDDVDRHIKGLSLAQKRVWVAVANDVLARCEQEGEADCEARAIRQANAAAKRDGVAVAEAQHMLAQDEAYAARYSAVQQALTRWVMDHALTLAADPYGMGAGEIVDLYPDFVVFRWKNTLWLAAYSVDAQGRVHLGDAEPVRLFYVPLHAAATVSQMEAVREAAVRVAEVTKTDDGQEYTASDYLYVPDPDEPSTWKLRIAEYVDGKKQVTAAQVGRAIAALSPGGFRGNRVELPADVIPRIKARLRQLWKRFHPDADPSAMPKHIAEATGATEMTLVEGACTPLCEAALRADGTGEVCIITPGWGTSGYYAADVLKRDAPRAFPAGTQMFWDHPTADEVQMRPEGSLRNLAGVLTADAAWRDDGWNGPGVYAPIKVFGDCKHILNEIAPYIGVSIHAAGEFEESEAEGRRGRVITALLPREMNSVDFVTKPGRGGRIRELVESLRSPEGGGRSMSDVELTQLRESVGRLERELQEARQAMDALLAQNREMRDALNVSSALDVIRTEIAKFPELSERARARVMRNVMEHGVPLTTEQAVDGDALRERVRVCAQEELEYLAAETGMRARGAIYGMGSPRAAESAQELRQRLQEQARRLGMSDDVARLFVERVGRA